VSRETGLRNAKCQEGQRIKNNHIFVIPMIVSNTKIKHDSEYISKEIRSIIYILPVYIILLFVAFYYSMRGDGIGIIIFFITFSVLILAVGISSQQKWLNKYSRVIAKINFNNDYIELYTNSILWKDSKELKIANSELAFKKKDMYWWAKKRRKKSTYIFNVEGKEYYLVEEYFDGINELIENLEVL